MEGIEIFESLARAPGDPVSENGDSKSAGYKKTGQADLFRQLKTDLLRATYEPGERLIEERLAEKYGASRTPIRQVLIRLASEGMIGVRGRSYTALKVSVDTMEEIYDVRNALENLAISEAIRNRNDAGLLSISQALDTMRESYSSGHTLVTNAADSLFHLRIAEMSGNHSLLQTLCQIHERVLLIRNQFFALKDLQTIAVVEHDHIFDAIERGARDIARAEISHHIKGTIGTFLNQIDHERQEKTA